MQTNHSSPEAHAEVPTSPTDKYKWMSIALIPFSFFIYFSLLWPRLLSEGPLTTIIPWVPALDVNLSFYLDGLSLLMALLIGGVGTIVFIYAADYLRGDAQIGRFYAIILLFMFAMLGVVMSSNIVLLFIAWELTSITSYMLIGYKHQKKSARDAALQALLITGMGGLVLLAGLIMLAQISGSWELSQILQSGDVVRDHALYPYALICILVGAFTKSAQWPFYSWLPNAMAAPAPVSSYLHSATMVKAGIYLLARLLPVLGGTPEWQYSLIVFGGITAVIGAWLSWQQTDLKRLLAYSTVSGLGILVFLLGIDNKTAYKAAILFLLAHALYKGAMFMAAGAIEHETGSRDVSKLAGLRRVMPFTMVALLLASLSKSGIPLLLGFISKEYIYEATLESAISSNMVTAVAVLTNILLVTSAAVLFIKPFFGKEDTETVDLSHVHEGGFGLWLGPIILGVVALMVGTFPALISESLVGPAVTAIAGKTVEVKLALWHGFTPMVMLSIVTVLGGAALYAVHLPLRAVAQGIRIPGPAQGYAWLLDGFIRFAAWQTKVIQSGYLRRYMMFVALTVVALVGYTAFSRLDVANSILGDMVQPEIYHYILAVVILSATLLAVMTESRLAAVVALGVVGYGAAMFYVLLGAPDLAMTQFSIETLTVVLFVLVLAHLPEFSRYSSSLRRSRDAVYAIAVGLVMMLLVLLVTAVPTATPVSDYFAANSYELAKGRNIVNVILVDYRGFDTMGEIVVLTVASIGVFALLRLRNPDDEPDDVALSGNEETAS